MGGERAPRLAPAVTPTFIAMAVKKNGPVIGIVLLLVGRFRGPVGGRR
jgi:hypothetical protein